MSRIMQRKSGLEQRSGMAYSFLFMLTCKGEAVRLALVAKSSWLSSQWA
jgi:hypothetical protein